MPARAGPAAVLVAATLVGAAVVGGDQAQAAERLRVRTSLGPITAEDTRDLRARGVAPRGSVLVVRFYRGRTRIALRRPRLDGRRFAAATAIDRTGDYTVRVTATRPDGTRTRASAGLTYGPKAEAPSAPSAPRATRPPSPAAATP